MVLQVLYTAVTSVLPFKYWPYAGVVVAVLVVIYAYAQGRTTNRERDLHARVILLTGPFTPFGLVTLNALAKRGAHIIALSPYPLSHPIPSLLLPVIRSTTNNEHIYAEFCDISSPTSIRKFCTTFLTGNDTRVDALVLAHEYSTIGRIWFFGGKAREEKERRENDAREAASLASFLLITLLLPALLVAPVERDIRVVSVVNPFYAAALPTLPAFLNSTPSSPAPAHGLLASEGLRSLRTVIVTRHLQRILDSLPNRRSDAQSKSSSSKPASPPQSAPSNILSVSACPGVSRRDTIAPLLGTGVDGGTGWSPAYLILLLPLLLFTKSSESALQTLLHALFLPTPMKRMQARVDAAADEETRKAEEEARRATAAEGDGNEGGAGANGDGKRPAPKPTGNVEVLKPGALYRECAVVQLDIPVPPPPPQADKSKTESVPEDDGEFGGEAVGRAVWEWYETRLKEWEELDRAQVKAEEEAEAKAKAETDAGEREGDGRPASSASS